jgi:hypothetical protein
MPDSMPEASPTLMLMPGQGFDNTVALQVRLTQRKACVPAVRQKMWLCPASLSCVGGGRKPAIEAQSIRH